MLGVAVGDVDADIGDRRAALRHHRLEFFIVGLADAHRVERGRLGAALVLQSLEEPHQLVFRIMLVQGRRQVMVAQRAGHFHGAGAVHVGGDDGNAAVGAARVVEGELAVDVDVRARREGRALRAYQYILEIELD